MNTTARKIARRVMMALSAGAVSLLFQACYGTPQDLSELDDPDYLDTPAPVEMETNAR